MKIIRIDVDNIHGWQVQFWFMRVVHLKFFADNKYGNKIVTELASKNYVERLEKAIEGEIL